MNMQAVPRYESYRDFNFVSFDPNIIPLVDYLGNAKEYLDVYHDVQRAAKPFPAQSDTALRPNVIPLQKRNGVQRHAI